MRDNQRRSRLRQKELIADLQKRLDEYQRLGVQATQEMQREARQVAGENEKLRSLLRRKGVSDAEVEGYLRSPSTTPVSRQPPRQSIAGYVPPVPDLHHQLAATSGFLHELPATIPVRSHHHHNPGPVRRTHQQAIKSARSTTIEQTPLSYSPDQLGSRESTYSSQADPNACCTSGTEMSCDVAADILASMQGHTDTSRAREVLGCTGPSDCVVKSIRVFDLLDKAA